MRARWRGRLTVDVDRVAGDAEPDDGGHVLQSRPGAPVPGRRPARAAGVAVRAAPAARRHRVGRRVCARSPTAGRRPRSPKSIATWPAACGGIDVDEHAALAGIERRPPRTGCSVPTSWLRPLHVDTMRSRLAPRSSTASTSTRPSPSTPTSVTSPCGLRRQPHGRVLDRRNDMVSAALDAPHTAVAIASVAPLVKIDFAADRAPEERRRRHRGPPRPRPAAQALLVDAAGVSGRIAHHEIIASAAAGRRGEVDAWSR